ncbi:MAG: hypothetical protein AAF355_10215 [Myxococcota bacterium]
MSRFSLHCWALVLAMLCTTGCVNHGTRNHTTAYEGDLATTPRLESLPQPDLELAKMSDRMRFAFSLAEESFEIRHPTLPGPSNMKDLQDWASKELEPWLRRKNERVEAARAELDLAASESHRERILAGALVGLLYEDVARVLLNVPTPIDLLDEPEIAQIYREIIDFQARPYLEHAFRAYRACALNAVEPLGMRHFSSFCRARAVALPRDDGAVNSDEFIFVHSSSK